MNSTYHILRWQAGSINYKISEVCFDGKGRESEREWERDWKLRNALWKAIRVRQHLGSRDDLQRTADGSDRISLTNSIALQVRSNESQYATWPPWLYCRSPGHDITHLFSIFPTVPPCRVLGSQVKTYSGDSTSVSPFNQRKVWWNNRLNAVFEDIEYDTHMLQFVKSKKYIKMFFCKEIRHHWATDTQCFRSNSNV